MASQCVFNKLASGNWNAATEVPAADVDVDVDAVDAAVGAAGVVDAAVGAAGVVDAAVDGQLAETLAKNFSLLNS